MNIRPDAWRRAFRSPQVILSLLALVGALLAVFVARPDRITVEPFELPVVEETSLTREEVRIITFDRFNLEIPLLMSLEVPGHAAGRVAVIVEAVRNQLQGQNGAWPEALPLPVVFVPELDQGQTAVLDFRPESSEMQLDEVAFSRLRRSLEATLHEAGMEQVVLLMHGQPPQPVAAGTDQADGPD